MKILRLGSAQLERLYRRQYCFNGRIVEKVRKILNDVRVSQDEAVLRYTRKFDKIKLSPKELKVRAAETSGAYQDIKPDFVNSLKLIIENVERFYKKELKKSWRIKAGEGVILGEKFEPLERVGIYVPSGTAPLVSTVYMTVLPAKIAGVKEIIIATPPNKFKSVDPHILVVADLLKVDKIFKVGGAQAIAAMAFGTKVIPKVDKVIGPGNVYVTEAKRQVFGFCDVDMIAGPSEAVVLANRSSNPDYVKADLEAQSEHAGGLSILVTTSKRLARIMKKEVQRGYVVLVSNLDEAIDVINNLAPEHLEILVKRPRKILARIKNAGCIFVGPYSPVCVGDYVAGPSHVLPTNGTSRFFSGLRISDFVKSSHVISYSKKGLEKVREPLEAVANIEGLPKHLDSLKVRLE